MPSAAVQGKLAPNQTLDTQAFERGLAWATKEVAAFAALVLREHPADVSAQRFRAFDAVVSWAENHDPPLGQAVWAFVLAHAGDRDLLGVGMAAYQAEASDMAISAFEQTADSADPSVAAPALYDKGIVLDGLGQTQEAVAAYEQLAGQFNGSADVELLEMMAAALVNRGLALGRLGRVDDELAAIDQLVERFGGSDDPVIAQNVARALNNKSIALRRQDRTEEAVATCEQLVGRFGVTDDAEIARQVAMALVNQGAWLGEVMPRSPPMTRLLTGLAAPPLRRWATRSRSRFTTRASP